MSDTRTSPKKARKPQSRSLPIRAAVVKVVAEYDRMSVRQLYYQLVARGVIDKTEAAHLLYRRNYWISQPVHVEVWCEKDALTGVIQPVCERYGVTYVATRGFPSITLRYESARAIAATAKPARIFYFGDHDASGQRISANLEAEL